MKTVVKNLIKTKEMLVKGQWTAFVTWNGYDLQEYGETERNAVLFLLERHSKFLGVTDVSSFIKSMGL